MARYTGPKCRLSRREGENLLLKKKCTSAVRNFPPGQHGNKRKTKLSNYGVQMREKQKVKRLYGILEKQFKLYYLKASRSKGITGSVLLQFLERRLDNTLFRLGFASTRAQGRQIVNHGLTRVNGARVDIPSYQVKVGDEIGFKDNENMKKYINANLAATKDWKVPGWLTADAKNLKGKVNHFPERDDVQFPINEQLIIELYSK